MTTPPRLVVYNPLPIAYTHRERQLVATLGEDLEFIAEALQAVVDTFTELDQRLASTASETSIDVSGIPVPAGGRGR